MTDETLATRFEMRASPKWLDQLDEWRRAQVDLPGRAEAIRRLASKGLQAEKDGFFMLGDTWNNWFGGPCPVDPDESVTAKLRGGGLVDGYAGDIKWEHTGGNHDVVAARKSNTARPRRR